MKKSHVRSLAGALVEAAFRSDNHDKIFKICNQAAILSRRERLYFLLSVSAILCRLGMHLDKSANEQIDNFFNNLLVSGDLRP